jgi:DNA-binding transcriptional ArsR family regulator
MKNREQEKQVRSRIFTNLSLITHTLAAPARLRILQNLSNRPYAVDELSDVIQKTIGNTSQHLQRMLKAGLVTCERAGVSRIYQLSNPKVLDIWLALQSLASDLNPQIKDDEIELCPPNLCAQISFDEAMIQVKNKKAILLDARSKEDIVYTPVPGAMIVNGSRINTKISEIPKSKTIYVFCRGPYCTLANPIVESLRKNDYKAFRLKENFFQINQLLQGLHV